MQFIFVQSAKHWNSINFVKNVLILESCLQKFQCWAKATVYKIKSVYVVGDPRMQKG